MPDRKATDRKFVTNFEGDEINGTFYGLNAPVTGLDAATGDYLVRAGRISEVTDEHFAELTANDDPDGEFEPQNERNETSGAGDSTDSSTADYDADLLVDDTAGNDLKTEAELRTIAEAEGVTLKSSYNKAQIADAIMTGRSASA